MRRATPFVAVILLGALAPGCRATIPNDTFACSADDQCPAGFQCVGGFCNDSTSAVDAGGVDAGPGLDAGRTDAGGTDAGGTDAGGTDAGGTDAGGTDAGGTDAGGTDAGGTDAGTPESSLAECSDGVDNDGDGLTDCEEADCCATGACTPGVLACDCPALAARTAVTVSGTIPPGTEWSCDQLYTLEGVVNVEGGDLTVHPGTTVLARSGAGLFVERDARLLAVGTEARPIQFTSASAVGARAAGDWYGVFVFGQAPINDPAGTSTIPGFPADVVAYGGSNAAHDCGHLEYVNLTFGGQDANVNLALIGCGTGTTVRYVHTAHSLDTNLYVGGGTLRLDHVSSFASGDEGFLYSEGWVGSVQYLFVGAAGGAGIRGRTSFVDGARTPFSTPAIWNATVTRAMGSNAVDLISGAGLHMGNSILSQVTAPNACFAADTSAEPRIPTNLEVRNSILWDCAGTMGFDAGTEATTFAAGSYANRFTDPMLNVATPLPASPAASGAATPPAGLVATPYIGAFEPAAAGTLDWTDAWADYSAN